MKNAGFRLVAAMITLALAGGVATATGCGGSAIASLCADICSCERCTSNDLQTCEDKGNAASDAADTAGCSSEFAAAVTCSGTKVSCKDEHAVADGCDDDLAALTKCSSTLSLFGKTACELASDQVAAKLRGCPMPPMATTTTSGGGAPECSEATGALALCQAASFAAASCDCIGAGDVTQCTAEQAKTFTDAFTACK